MDAVAGLALGALGGALVVWALTTIRASRRGRSPAAPETAETTPETPADGSERRNAEIVERVSEGVLVLDGKLALIFANAAGRRMLGFDGPGLPRRLSSEEVLAVAQRSLNGGAPSAEILSLWYPRFQTLRVRASPISGDAVAVLLEDVTEEFLAQKVRREFVMHASHELKSPVAGMQVLAEAVAEAISDDPEAAERFSERLVSESHRLGRLINDLLDLSRLEEPVQMPEEPVDITDIARNEVDQLRGLARTKLVSFTAELRETVLVHGDEQQLGLLVRNLLDNAIRYTPEGGNVRISVRREEDSAVIEVSDSGIGIPREAQTRVFERFYRVDKARSRDKGGTGLGLAIVKHVAELHGGSVKVRSELGQGSTFTARVPSAAPTDQAIDSIAG